MPTFLRRFLDWFVKPILGVFIGRVVYEVVAYFLGYDPASAVVAMITAVQVPPELLETARWALGGLIALLGLWAIQWFQRISTWRRPEGAVGGVVGGTTGILNRGSNNTFVNVETVGFDYGIVDQGRAGRYYDVIARRFAERPDEPDATPKWATEQIRRSLELDEHQGWQELHEAAALGQIVVWGRPSNSFHRPREPIPAVHWRDYSFDFLHCEYGEPENCASDPYDDRRHFKGECYRDLLVSRNQIQKKWPVQESMLQLSVGDSRDYDAESGRKGVRTIYTIDRRYGVAIENHDPKSSLRDCRLLIMSIEPDSGWRMPKVLAEGLIVHPGDRHLVQLAMYNEPRRETSSVAGDTIIVIDPDNPNGGLSVGLDNVVTLRATALDVPPTELRCGVWVENERLRVQKIN